MYGEGIVFILVGMVVYVMFVLFYGVVDFGVFVYVVVCCFVVVVVGLCGLFVFLVVDGV